MKRFKIILLGAGLLAVTLAGGMVLRKKNGSAPWRAGMAANGFAVVELFTSEGCSSCPPADALVARIQQEDKGLPVYILAYHVDYWDRLGWKDAFSEGAYSDRQRRYASWLNLSSVYTPQVIVNGRKEFVGSDAGTLRAAIENGLQQPGGVQLSLSGLRLDGNKLGFHYEVTGGGMTSGRYEVVAAIVEHSASTHVRAGENSGKVLSHVQIVRSIGMWPVRVGSPAGAEQPGDGEVKLDWPSGVASGDAEVIAFIQDQDNGKIIAAARAKG
jgi:hypothetical protein